MAMPRLEIIILTAALLVGNARAQQVERPDDALIVARQVYSVALENPYLVVVNVNVPPHFRSAMHTHQDLAAVIVALGEGHYVLTGEDGVSHDARQKRGVVAYREAGRMGLATRHQVENPGDTPVRAVRVELKDYPPFRESLPLQPDSRYSVEIDNERVRVFRIRLAPKEALPGLILGPHVIVALNDSGSQHAGDSRWVDVGSSDQRSDQRTRRGRRHQRANDLRWIEAGQEPINNTGDRPSEMIVVELKGRRTSND